MNKILLFSAVVLIPVLFFANVWQSFRYATLKREITRLESVQVEILEKNKRSIAGISILETPERIEKLSRDVLRLARTAAKDFIIIKPQKKERETDG